MVPQMVGCCPSNEPPSLPVCISGTGGIGGGHALSVLRRCSRSELDGAAGAGSRRNGPLLTAATCRSSEMPALEGSSVRGRQRDRATCVAGGEIMPSVIHRRSGLWVDFDFVVSGAGDRCDAPSLSVNGRDLDMGVQVDETAVGVSRHK